GIVAGARAEVSQRDSQAWVADLTDARDIWSAARRSAPLSAAAPNHLFEAGEAGALDGLLRAAGFAMRSVTIEVDENDLAAREKSGMEAIERLRARGWGIALRCAEDCPLALGTRGRSLFTELLAPTPDNLSPALVLADPMASPLTRRVRAAQSFGLTV